MEKKKLLLVAVSVGVALLFIIGIPLMIIAPRQNNSMSPAEASVSTGADQNRFMAFEPYQTPAEMQGAFGNAQPEDRVIAPPVEMSSSAEPPQVTTITVPAPQTAAVPNTPVAAGLKPVTPKPAAVKTSTLTPARAVAETRVPAAEKKPVQVAAQPAAVKRPAAQAKPAAAKTPVETPKSSNNNYWVQTGAFSTKVRAEGMKETLASKGITSIIDNRDIDGKTWFRVRVGPYMSESEANYWLALVKSMDGFADSQVRQSPAMR